MWGGDHGQGFVPDSMDDDEGFRVVYGDDDGAGVQEPPQAGRALRTRYALPQAGSAVKAAAPGRVAGSAPVAAAEAEAGVHSPGHSGSPQDASRQEAPLTLAQELQTVLQGLTQEQQQAWQQRRTGIRHIKQSSPAVPPAAPLPAGSGAAAADGGPSSGRRWRRTQAAAAAQLRSPEVPQGQAAPAEAVPAAAAIAAGAAGGGGFFSVDADLAAHAQRQVAAVPGGARQQRRQQRTVQWDSPRALPAGQADHTPLQSQRANPLAALLGNGGGGGSAVKPRAATTGSRPRGRHPIYGHALPASSAGTGGAATSSGIRLQELGLGDAPLTSPRQQQQQQRRRQLQQAQHSRFAIREAAPPAAGAASADAASQQVTGLAPGLRLLTGSEPASAVRQQQFQPRPRRPPSPGEQIAVDGEEGDEADAPGRPLPPPQQAAWQQQQQQQQQLQQPQQQWPQEEQAGGAQLQAAADSFRTPGQPLRQSRLEGEQVWPGVGDSTGAARAAGGNAGAAATPGTGGSHRGALGCSGGKPGAMSLQRQFIAQLQPVSRPAAAATMQQQRQRLAGASGLHARMQAILAAEKAGLMQSPGSAGGSGPRLTVISKELHAGITECRCRCDAVAAAALGASEATALLQNRTAREVDTTPGSVLLLKEPWRVVLLPGSQWPVVLCYAASQG